jgi:hypothetical protein
VAEAAVKVAFPGFHDELGAIVAAARRDASSAGNA